MAKGTITKIAVKLGVSPTRVVFLLRVKMLSRAVAKSGNLPAWEIVSRMSLWDTNLLIPMHITSVAVAEQWVYNQFIAPGHWKAYEVVKK